MRVLLADNHTLFRQGLMRLLSTESDISVVGEASDGWAAVTETRRLNPDLVILEVRMPEGNGLETLKKIREDAPNCKLLVLTVSEGEADLWQAVKNGAQGYLLKDATPEQLLRAIRDIMSGEMVITPYLAGKMLRRILSRREGDGEDSQTKLTPREREVLGLLGTGVSDEEIGRRLCLAGSTVRHHVHNILHKLQLRNRVQAAMFARSQYPDLHYERGEER
ncbi:MAG: response regulator transcription factor [Chloroflexi bacterium]|nr:response regulator transcription factor [Chloroflexota bacterium]